MNTAARRRDSAPRTRATYQDVLDAPAHRVAEIIDGVLYTQPRPASPHALATSSLGSDLAAPFQFGRGGPGGWWIIDEPELHLGEDILVPDLAGWRRERMPAYPDVAYFTLPPDRVCEVLSASTRRIDLHGKRPIRAGGGGASVARRPGGPHPGSVRIAPRRVGAVRDGEGRRPGAGPPLRGDNVQPRRLVALNPPSGPLAVNGQRLARDGHLAAGTFVTPHFAAPRPHPIEPVASTPRATLANRVVE